MKRFLKWIPIALLAATYNSYGQADQPQAADTEPKVVGACCSGNCCDGSFTPLGVMTDHIHAKGEWMASYTYMDMTMRGNRTGTSRTSDSVLYAKGYMMAPASMTMHMHMAMLMYGLTDRLTLMAMGGYTSYNMSMNMQFAMIMPGMKDPAASMTTTSSGVSDTRVSALYNFSKSSTSRLIGSLGISLPTGSYKVKGVTMLGTNERLPYDMQPGTGSFALQPDVTFAKQAGKMAWGVNAGADIKLNKNDLKYRQGNSYHATAWVAYKVLPFASLSLRGEGVWVDKISGADSVIANPVYEQFDPTTSTSHYGGTWGNAYAGLNFHWNKPVIKNFQAQIEYGIPFYENLNGPQMSVHSTLLAGLSYRF